MLVNDFHSRNGRIDELESSLGKAEELMQEIGKDIEVQRGRVKDLIVENVILDDIAVDRIRDFAGQPYCILPKSANEAWVVVPRFVPFQVGWLERQTESYNVFVVNKYVSWITDIPEEIRSRVGIESKYEKAKLVGDSLLEFANEEEREVAWDELHKNLYKRVDDNKVQINKGKEFEVVASLIKDGNLPFRSSPVADEDLRGEPEGIELRGYQERAWEKFLDTGMIGVFWSPGSGKTFFALYAGERVFGRKLVVVPSNTLKEQWNERINRFCSYGDEWEVQTYQYLTRGSNLDGYQGTDIGLVVFDEVHHLPANSFSKLSTIDAKYRIGLSASPYREDGRTEFIFSLSGFPVGLKWQELISLGVVEEPDVKVFLYSTGRKKRDDLSVLVGERPGKILIFCDSLVEGRSLSSELDVPFVYGATRDRMDKFRDNRVIIGSRVADEGLSIGDIDVVIEYGFLYGSRRQEAQRVGRVMHGEGRGEHIVMMTDDELANYEKRLYSLENQGFRVRFERRG